MTRWDELFAARQWGRWPSEAVVRQVSRFAIQRSRRLQVVEVGCAAGAHLWFLQHEGHQAVGVDLSMAGLDQARQRLQAERQPIRLARADAGHLPVRSGACDLVIDVEAFAHIPSEDCQRLWSEASRILRPGGRVVSVGFTRETYGSETGHPIGQRSVIDLAEGPLKGIGIVTFAEERTVVDLMSGVGLEVLEVQHLLRTTGPQRWPVVELLVMAELPQGRA